MGGQRDMTKPTVPCHNFANASKNGYAFTNLSIGSPATVNVLHTAAQIDATYEKMCPSSCYHTYLSNYYMDFNKTGNVYLTQKPTVMMSRSWVDRFL
jgi:hypothetical protein